MDATQRQALLDIEALPKKEEKIGKNHTIKCRKLLEAWFEKNITKFSARLSNANYFDYTYPYLNDLRILDIITTGENEKEVKKFLEKALEFRPNLNERNPKTGKTVAHYAIENNKFDAFELLFRNGSDPNIQDTNGNTILHYIVEKYEQGSEKILELLLKWEFIDLNIPNLKGETPIALAASLGHKEIVEELLKFGSNLSLDIFRNEMNENGREVILKNFPDLSNRLPGKWEPTRLSDYKNILFHYLSTSQQNEFLEIMEKLKEKFNEQFAELLESVDATGYTLLQKVCMHKSFLQKIMKRLLNEGANVNNAPPQTEAPIFLALRSKNYAAFEFLYKGKEIKTKPNAKRKTLLHVFIKKMRRDVFVREDMVRILARDKNIDINAQDYMGQTALHLAVTRASERVIFTLLDNGARLDIINKFGHTPLHHLDPKTYENYLNKKITSNLKVQQDLKYSVNFDYKFISSENGTEHIHDISTKALKIIRQSKNHRKFLAHPLLATIIFFKWRKIRYLFYLYLMISILFCCLFSAFIFFGPKLNSELVLIVQIILWIYLLIKGSCAIFNIYSYPRHIENYIPLAMVIVSLISIEKDCPQNFENWQHCRVFSAYAVLLNWFELFFVIGKHPSTNYFIDMFRTASCFLLQFIAVHTALILAFVLSFYVIFGDNANPFQSITGSFFKTILMVTGEYDANDIPFDEAPIMSRLLFILFLFLVATVLFNLLIGLAVSATRPIEDDKFLYSCIAQVPIIAFIETIFFKNPQFVKHLFNKKDCTENENLSSTYPFLSVFPNRKKNQMKIHVKERKMDLEKMEKIKINHNLEKRIIEDAQQILETKSINPNIVEEKIDQLQQTLEETTKSFQEKIGNLEKILEANINLKNCN